MGPATLDRLNGTRVNVDTRSNEISRAYDFQYPSPEPSPALGTCVRVEKQLPDDIVQGRTGPDSNESGGLVE